MSRPTKGISWYLAVLLASPISIPGGCAPAPLRASFNSPNPTEKLYAIEQAVRNGDPTAVPHIIEQLDSDDPAVRMVAISALERLTGETHGYVHYAARHERAAAIARWIEAEARGQRSEERDQRSEVRDQKSELHDQRPALDDEALTSDRSLPAAARPLTSGSPGGADD